MMLKLKFKIQIALPLWGVLLPLFGFSQTVVYVSTHGNDLNPGTRIKPLQSIQKAVSKVKSIKGAVVIKIFGGTYYFARPLVFNAGDSRKDGQTLTLSNLDNEKVIISGSALINKPAW